MDREPYAVDADAVLLRSSEVRNLQSAAGLTLHEQTYFLYVPERLYHGLGFIEKALTRIPLGGQYAVFAELI